MKAIRSIDFIVILSILSTLIAFQIPHLSLGHFWDEAWVYAPAVRSMGFGTPSLLPDALSTDLTRGHPLLFQFLGGLWMKIFGTSNTSAHSFALSISLFTLVCIYFLVRNAFNRGAAITACALVGAQPVFLAQSSMLYPEMLMSLGLVLATFGYVQRKNWLFALGLSVAVYSKETAVVFFIAFLLWDGLLAIFNKGSQRSFKKYLVPLIVLLSHPFLLYLYHGWFLYPDHTGYLTFDFSEIKYNAKGVFRFLFEKQNRGWIIFPVAALAALGLNLKKSWLSLIYIGVGFAAYKIFVWRWWVPEWLYAIIMLVAILLPLAIWIWQRKSMEVSSLHHFIGIGYFTIVGFVIFSAMNFYTARYMLSMVVLVCAMASVIIWNHRYLNVWAKTAVSIVVVSLSLYTSATEKYVGELNLGLYDDLKVQGAMVDWMTENASRDSHACTNFVTQNYLCNEYSGYVNSENFFYKWFADICNDCQESEYIIITKTGCKNVDPEVLIPYTQVYADTLGRSTAVVYRLTELNQ